MDILKDLLKDEDKKTIEIIKSELKFTDDEFNSIVNILIPEVTNAIGQSMNDGTLMFKLMNALSSINLGEPKDITENLLSAESKESGKNLLEGILGDSERVGLLCDKILKEIDVERSQVETLLPVLTMAVVSVVMKNGAGLGGLVNGLMGSKEG